MTIAQIAERLVVIDDKSITFDWGSIQREAEADGPLKDLARVLIAARSEGDAPE